MEILPFSLVTTAGITGGFAVSHLFFLFASVIFAFSAVSPPSFWFCAETGLGMLAAKVGMVEFVFYPVP